MKKIGIDASFLRKPGTGIGQVTANFLKELAGFQFPSDEKSEYILYCEEEPRFDFSLPENFKIKTFLPLWKRDDLIRRMLWERQVAKWVVADDCGTFLSLYQSATSFKGYTSKAKSHTSFRHTMIVHDIIPKLFSEYRGNMRQAFHWRMVERGIRNADHIVAVSECTKQDLVREFGLVAENISVAYPDTAQRFRVLPNEEQVMSVLRKYDLTKGYIYHGGGLEIRKNAEGVLKAYAQLVENRGQSAEIPDLVISGKIFSKENKLATDIGGLIETLGLQGKVKLLGFVPDEDVPALYRGALFFVYPSLYEGFGLPVLEALRMETPILVAKNSSLPEVGGEAVLYCDAQNIQTIVAGMERLLNEKDLRENLISKSRAQVIRFDWKRFVTDILVS